MEIFLSLRYEGNEVKILKIKLKRKYIILQVIACDHGDNYKLLRNKFTTLHYAGKIPFLSNKIKILFMITYCSITNKKRIRYICYTVDYALEKMLSTNRTF